MGRTRDSRRQGTLPNRGDEGYKTEAPTAASIAGPVVISSQYVFGKRSSVSIQDIARSFCPVFVIMVQAHRSSVRSYSG